MKKILITGAAGNLGGLLARHLLDFEDIMLRLMIHRRPLPHDLAQHPKVETTVQDLARPEGLPAALEGVDVLIHFAGVLFRHQPEKFLQVTNTQYFNNLLKAAAQAGVRRVVLISFPHVEGPTTPDRPASGRLDAHPVSVHAQTRLQEEIALLKTAEERGFEAVILRVGMVYGKGILMIEGARWFARHRLLGVWKEPTDIHLISTPDFLAASTQALLREGIRGIYHLGDEGRQTLQAFLDAACTHWGYRKPWRMPLELINCAAWHFEMGSLLFGLPSPLTRDFIRIGRVSYYGDTSRMRAELLATLQYPDLQSGIGLL